MCECVRSERVCVCVCVVCVGCTMACHGYVHVQSPQRENSWSYKITARSEVLTYVLHETK